MYDLLKALVLRVSKVPPEPEAPGGSAESVQVFRASYGYFRYRCYVWAFGQLVVALSLAAAVVPMVMQADGRGPALARVLVLAMAVIFVLSFLVELVVSYTTLRLDYELRWYVVTDRSLRIREGVWHVREMTLTFANIQNLAVSQGPLQRWFGIADLRVQTAGGGNAQPNAQSGAMHLGILRGIDNAPQVRDLMMERLRRLKDTGLGDSDEAAPPAPGRGSQLGAEALAALRELAEEATRLHARAGKLGPLR